MPAITEFGNAKGRGHGPLLPPPLSFMPGCFLPIVPSSPCSSFPLQNSPMRVWIFVASCLIPHGKQADGQKSFLSRSFENFFSRGWKLVVNKYNSRICPE